MQEQFDLPVHGSFAISFNEAYTLISVAGSWNQICAEIYKTLLEKRVESRPDLRRCIIIDGRDWGLDTPDCQETMIALNERLSGYYRSLHVACILNPGNKRLAQFILDMHNRDFNEVSHWNYFDDVPQAVAWLRGEGHDIPDLSDEEFPEPIHAREYLKHL